MAAFRQLCLSRSLRLRSCRNALPLSGFRRARAGSPASLGASRPDCLHGLFSGTAEVDVTPCPDFQGTPPLLLPPVPIPLHGSDPSTCWAGLGGVAVGLWCGGDMSHRVRPL